MFLLRTYEGGLRGRQTTSMAAGLHWHFTAALLPTKFLSSTLLETARTACRATAVDLRYLRN